jgi:seryl-tRNA synthetase
VGEINRQFKENPQNAINALTRGKPAAEAAEPVKATSEQIEGFKRRRDEAQEEIKILSRVEGIQPEKIQAKKDEIEHLDKQIKGELPPDALPPTSESSKAGVEKRIGEMYAAKTPEEQKAITAAVEKGLDVGALGMELGLAYTLLGRNEEAFARLEKA